jgi:streptogramin lyase
VGRFDHDRGRSRPNGWNRADDSQEAVMQSLSKDRRKQARGLGPPSAVVRSVTLTLMLGLSITSSGTAQQPGPAKSPSRSAYDPAVFPVGATARPGAPAAAPSNAFMARIRESEPNNTPPQANRAAIGDVVEGEVNPAGDRDFVSFQVEAGSALVLTVAASAIGSRLDPTVTLYSPSGVLLAFNDDFNGLDSRIAFTIPTTGVYLAMVTGYAGMGGPGHAYELGLEILRPGPGDPTTSFATGFEAPWAMAAGGDGSLFVVSRMTGIVRSVSPTGQVREVANGLEGALGAALDGGGRLLVVEQSRGRISRIDPTTGANSVFAEGFRAPVAVTVGPDAAVWVSDAATQQLYRFNSEGRRERSIPLGSVPAISLAFSPSGSLYVAGYSGVFRLEGSSLVRVLSVYVDAIAFDQDGYLYALNGNDGVVDLYDASFRRVHTVARSNIQGPSTIAFLRDTQGRMTSRLVISNSEGTRVAAGFRNGIVELNPGGVRASGHRVGIDFLRLTVADVLPRGVLGAPYSLQLSLTEQLTEAARWSLVSGRLPPGVSLDDATGMIEGTPEESGTWSFRVRVETETRFGASDHRLEVQRPVIRADRAASHLLGVSGALDADEQRFFDLIGNRNGRYDLGDFLLFLNHQGSAQSAAAGAASAIRRIP